MRVFGAALLMIGLTACSLEAQGGGRYDPRAQGIPPGHLPPPGACRVWYENVPPGRQPPPMRCDDAERVASRSRNARVIYGGYGASRDDDRHRGSRAIPRTPADVRRGPGASTRVSSGYASVPYANGYEDGFKEGRDDADDRDRYDPERHGRFRDADRGYSSRYGWSREQYRTVYRQGFLAGYADGYRARYR